MLSSDAMAGREVSRTRRAQRILMLAALPWLGCQRSPAAEPAPASASAPKPRAPVAACQAPASEVHYDAPQTAYAAYAEAVNQARWCDAIAVFEPASKPRIAVANSR